MRSQVLAKLLHHEGFVVGPVADVHFGDGVAFEDDQVSTDAVEEPAIVADDDGCAREFFEGAQGVDVEAVSGFVEQGDVGAG